MRSCLVLVACLISVVACAAPRVHEPEAARPPQPIAPSRAMPAAGAATASSPSEDRDVAFQSAELTLVGTLSLPARAAASRVPAVILIGGSGPSTRDENLSGQLGMSFGFKIPAFRLLADGLRSHGIAVLRYDKRSCGRFDACADNDYPVLADTITTEDFEADVLAAVDYAKRSPEIDPARVSVVGHSEGGAFVIPLLARRPDLRSGVLLSAPFKPVDRSVFEQAEFLRTLMRSSGIASDQIDQKLAPLSNILTALTALRAGTYTGGPIAGAYPVYWRSLMKLGDENPALSHSLDRPLLAIGGGYDWNVPPSELSAWQANFEASPHAAQRKTKLLACMTHALNCVSQPDPNQLKPTDIGTVLQSELVSTIADFINAQ